MKKITFKNLVSIFLMACVLTLLRSVLYNSNKPVLDNRISSIDIDMTLHQDGSATINDTRIFHVFDGSEFYISHSNLEGIELLDYAVYDQNGIELEEVDKWDSSLSREEKKGKYGLVEKDDGFELVVGYGDYGGHLFTFKYSLSNFVFNLEDNHLAFYWSFVKDINAEVGQVDIRISNDFGFEFAYPDTRIWAFGFDGQTMIEGNNLLAYSESPLSQDDYLVLLSIFEGQAFSTRAQKNITSQELIDMAMEGAETKTPWWLPLALALFVLFFTILFTFIANWNKIFTGVHKEKYKEPRDLAYYKEIPYKSFIRTSYLVDAKNPDILSAYILKWILNDKLIYIKEANSKKKDFKFKIIDESIPDNINEKRLWHIFEESADLNKIITRDSLVAYAKKNPKIYHEFFSKLDNNSRNYLYEKGHYEKVKKTNFGKTRTIYSLTETGKALGDKVFGFKKYLKNFSKINERQVIEVKLWKHYLIWASFLGIGDRVYKELRLVDPNIGEVNTDYSLPVRSITSVSRLINLNYTRSYNRSIGRSGSGGGSFRGGGRGSFGGGGGGFR